jgi:hypothetical protein
VTVNGTGFLGEMKIEIIKGVACNPWNMSALCGDVIEVDDKQAKELIAAERAVETDKPLTHVEEVTEAPIEEAPKKKGK